MQTQHHKGSASFELSLAIFQEDYFDGIPIILMTTKFKWYWCWRSTYWMYSLNSIKDFLLPNEHVKLQFLSLLTQSFLFLFNFRERNCNCTWKKIRRSLVATLPGASFLTSSRKNFLGRGALSKTRLLQKVLLKGQTYRNKFTNLWT